MAESIALALLLGEFVSDGSDVDLMGASVELASVTNVALTIAAVVVADREAHDDGRSLPGRVRSSYSGATFRDFYRVERSTFQRALILELMPSTGRNSRINALYGEEFHLSVRVFNRQRDKKSQLLETLAFLKRCRDNKTLCERLAPQFANRSVGMEKKILCSLWLLGNQESFQDVAKRFGMGKGTLHYVFRSVAQALSKCQAEAIQWPSVDQLANVAKGFRDKSGFPGVVGALGGTHVPIRGPPSCRNAYVNRSGFPSIHLQAVCDSSLRFLDVDTGRPGSTEGAEALRKSSLWSRLEGLNTMDYHLLADSAYPLETFLLSPYRDDGHLSELQRNYNEVHGSVRADIERAFGLLRRKWRRLKYLDMTAVAHIPAVISAACVLHNFLIDIERLSGDETDPETEPETHDDDGNPGCANQDVDATAASKRDGIARTLATTPFRTSRTSPE